MDGRHSKSGARVTGSSNTPASKIETDWNRVGQRTLSDGVNSPPYKEEPTPSEKYLKTMASGSLRGSVRKEPYKGDNYSLQITDAQNTPILYLRTNNPGIYFLNQPETVGLDIFRDSTNLTPGSDGIIRLVKVTKSRDEYVIAHSLLKALKEEEHAIDCKTPENFWKEIKDKNITPILI